MPEQRVSVWIQHFKDRPTLMLQWLDPDTGTRKSRSARTADPKEAEKARADLEYELNHHTYQEPSKLDWQKFRQLFEAEYVAGLREKTRQKYGTVLDTFEDIVKPAKLRAVSERTLGQFVKGMRERKVRGGKVGLASWSMKNYLVTLKTALDWAVDQKLIPSLPTFPTIKVPKKKPQPVPPEWFEKLLAKAPNAGWRAYMLCGWYGGLRLSEAWELRREPSEKFPWLDLGRGWIVLPAVFAKSDEDQWVPLHPVLRKALEELPRNGERVFAFKSRKGEALLTPAGISANIRDMAKRAGVKLSMHRLRKGFGCRVAQELGKGNAPILHRLMRHSSMQVTMDFYASVDDALGDAMNRLT